MATGSIYERNGIYYAVVNYYEKGKRRQKAVSTKLPVQNNKRNAQAVLKELIKEYEQKEALANMDGSNVLFTDFMEHWLEIIKPTIARSTFSSYSNMYSARIEKHFKKLGLYLTEVEPKHIKMLHDEILGEGLTGNTAIHYHSVIRSALQYAVKNGYIATNTADLVGRPKKNTHVANYYTKDEVSVLLKTAKSDPIYVPILISAYYGLRRSETLGLRWSSIDFVSKTVTINHKVTQLREDGKTVIYGEDKLKTKSSYRTLPLIPFVETELLKLKERQEKNRYLCGDSYCKEYLDYVCVNELGELFRPNYVSEHFAWLIKTNNLKKLGFKELRHSCASMLLAEKIPMKAIQMWLGHSNFSTTADIYAHIDFSSKMESADAIANALGSQTLAFA